MALLATPRAHVPAYCRQRQAFTMTMIINIMCVQCAKESHYGSTALPVTVCEQPTRGLPNPARRFTVFATLAGAPSRESPSP